MSINKKVISILNSAIDSRKSALHSFKESRLKFAEKIRSLPDTPKNKRIKALGGESLKKKSFLDNLRFRNYPSRKIDRIAADVTETALSGGAKELKKLKKLRKKHATKFFGKGKDGSSLNKKISGKVKFVRVRGRIVPIRFKS